jgi:hypothetical protein
MTAEVDVRPCCGFSGQPLTAERIDVEGMIVLVKALFAERKQKYITHRRVLKSSKGGTEAARDENATEATIRPSPKPRTNTATVRSGLRG